MEGPSPIVAMVTDRTRFGGGPLRQQDALVRRAAAAADAGVDFIHVRERDLSDRSLLALVTRIVAAITGSAARVLVNERLDIALAAGASGVHLPAAAPRSGRIRAAAPTGFLIGRSVHSEAEAIDEDHAGACDYLVFGTVFPTPGKPGASLAGVESLSSVCRRVRLPVLAIGGITRERVNAVAAAGAAGVAAIGLFAEVPEGATADLRAVVNEIRQAFAERGPGGH